MVFRDSKKSESGEIIPHSVVTLDVGGERVMKGFFPRKNRLLSSGEEHLELQSNIGDKTKRLGREGEVSCVNVCLAFTVFLPFLNPSGALRPFAT